jgi:hypothetical protein
MTKCSCSLDLGLHAFPPSSDGPQVDSLRTRFPKLVEKIAKKTEENYFYDNNPAFKLFPPGVRPDTKLGHGFTSKCNEKGDKENEKWLKKYAAIEAEQNVANQFIRHFSNLDTQGFLFHPLHTDTYLEKLKERSKSERKEIAKQQKCDFRVVPLSKLEVDICNSLGVDIMEVIEKSVSNLTVTELEKIIDLEALTFKKAKEREQFKTWVKKSVQTYDDKRNYVVYTHYREEVYGKRNCEIDTLFVLGEYQAVVEVEVKSISDTASANNVLKCAQDS